MIEKIFSADGALGKSILGFQPRQSQTDMAKAVHQAIQSSSQLVVEAGTGTGKTFAYLAPALIHCQKGVHQKVIISTGSKNLQDQLFHRDLPTMVDAMNFRGVVALLKGRSNYLCIDRLSRQLLESHNEEADPELLSQLVKVRHWSSESKTGDLGECDAIDEDSPVISQITSTNDNCLGKDCPSFQDCFVLKARKKALDADVVVVNHHLFLADLAIKETGFGELIPEADVFIFDEAHQLPDIASHYFGQSISSRQIQELGKDIDIAYRTEARDMRQLPKIAIKLSQTYMDLRIILGNLNPQLRGNWRDVVRQPSVMNALEDLQKALEITQEILKLALGRSQLLDAAYERTIQISQRLMRVCDTNITGYSYWYECTPRHFVLHITPLSIAEKFKQHLSEHKGSWIFTSATLAMSHSSTSHLSTSALSTSALSKNFTMEKQAAKNEFVHFNQRLGLSPQQELTLLSPFDYQNQALLCVPRYLPEPNHPNMAKVLIEQLLPVIESNQGRCFLLCTSHYMMKNLAEGLRNMTELPVLMQGETTKQALLNQFIELGNAVLVATGAFWEGIDVRGQTLSCVIIDKLPFSPPDDPLIKARIEDCRLRGGEPFVEVQLPDAVITLKQGVGRLIRDKNDRGALIICDNRLVKKDYRNVFLQSLPPMPRTRSLEKVSEFLSNIRLLDKKK